MRPLKVAVNSITIVAVLLWVVAALVVGSMIYLSALERLRDFAVFKAVGVPTRNIAAGLGDAGGRRRGACRACRCRAVDAARTAVPDAGHRPDGGVRALPVIAVVIGLIASAAGLRRAVSVDPALAFGGP